MGMMGVFASLPWQDQQVLDLKSSAPSAAAAVPDSPREQIATVAEREMIFSIDIRFILQAGKADQF